MAMTSDDPTPPARPRLDVHAAPGLAVAVPLAALILWPPAAPRPALPAAPAPLRILAAPATSPARALFAAAAAVPAGDVPDLAGIAGRLPDDAVALVRDADGRARALRPGERIAGWTLEAIAADAALFTRGGERVRVAVPAE